MRIIYEMALLEGFGFLDMFGFSDLISNLYEIFWAFPIVFLVLGIVYCFYGREIFDFLNFLIGGFAGLGFALGLGFSAIGLLLISVVAFIVGGIIGWFAPYLLIGIVGFSLGLGMLVSVSPLIGIIAGIILAVGAILLFRFFLPALTSLLGGSLAAYVIFEWTGSEPISFIVGVGLVVAGIVYQYVYLEESERKRKKSKVLDFDEDSD